ncbi:hypothetical protein BCR43DRAFT_502914 [Syncephalastrum racemosum]|uniref:Uncharacterized protein n=1 Tax=Syncephalastrum racemosum TaxID=13706 RepID=A0A1X2HPU5_SYNRA|nr:hypothetical protein BCR43DRAFT_502914 [Syncephalastrum racemosum]
MAGMFMGGRTAGESLLGEGTLTETRGRTWAMGGDSGVATLANFIKHYNTSVEGASKGQHIPELCSGFPEQDVLNAALSGALAMNLDDEIDYLVKEMKSLRSVRYETDWKLITIQIGSNDLCSSCKSPWEKYATPERFRFYVDKAIRRIQTEIPRTIVNLGNGISYHIKEILIMYSVGVFDFAPLYQMTANQPQCRGLLGLASLRMDRLECPCFRGSEQDRGKMHLNAQEEQSSSFGVAWQPANVDFSSIPVSALRFNANYEHSY